MALLATLALAPIAMAAPVTYQPGSLIVPMDATYQNFGMFKAYGLVYRLLQNGVPVRWAIGDPKSPDLFNGVDFSDQSLYRTRAHYLRANRHCNGPALVHESQPAEHPHSNRVRTRNPRSVHR